MKKLAASSLAVALWLQGPAQGQSPFFQPAPQPIVPVAAATVSRSVPATPVVPVRVHFGGVLTKDGIVPLQAFMQHNAAPSHAPRMPTSLPRASGKELRQVSAKSDDGDAKRVVQPTDAFACEEDCAPSVTDPRFIAPRPDDMYRPERGPCGYRWYGGAEYLHWWVKRQESPTLLLVDVQEISALEVDARHRHAWRFTLGHWLDTHEPWAIEGSFLYVGTRQSSKVFRSNGVVSVAHPFTDAATGLPDDLAVAVDPPDLAPRSGVSEISTHSRMWSFEANLRRELCRTSHGHLDILFGYRQLALDEGLTIRDQIVYDTAPFPLSDATVFSYDQFGTHNRLYAGQVGLESEFNWRCFYLGTWGKFAFGAMNEVINISGGTVVRPTPGRLPPPPQVDGKSFPGSLYAQPSNIGRFTDSQFTAMPEVGVNVGFNITPGWRVGGGYNFLFINNVVRPGDAIDTTISRNQIPQLQPLATTLGTRPAPPSFVESTYWAHGVTVQMEFRY